MPRLACACLLGWLPATGTAAQEAVAQWRLASTPALVIGGDIALHRVTGAAALPANGLAIADAGNRRVLLFSARGELVRTLGSEGSGPGEFRSIAGISAFGDTVVTYDGLLARLTVWHADGRVLGTVRLPPYGESTTSVRGIAAPDEVILGTLEGAVASGADRLYVEQMSLLRFQPGSGTVALLERLRLGYRYFHAHGAGTTTYATPFLGSAHVSALAGGYAVVPLDSAIVEVRDPAGRNAATIRLPIERRRFRAEAIEIHRDSVLAALDRNPRLGPEFGQRLRDVYERIPHPELAPSVRRLVTIGGLLWVEVFPSPGYRAVEWLVVDPAAQRVRARITLPADLRVLGGDDRRLFVLARDEFDVELVRVYDVQR